MLLKSHHDLRRERLGLWNSFCHIIKIMTLIMLSRQRNTQCSILFNDGTTLLHTELASRTKNFPWNMQTKDAFKEVCPTAENQAVKEGMRDQLLHITTLDALWWNCQIYWKQPLPIWRALWITSQLGDTLSLLRQLSCRLMATIKGLPPLSH